MRMTSLMAMRPASVISPTGWTRPSTSRQIAGWKVKSSKSWLSCANSMKRTSQAGIAEAFPLTLNCGCSSPFPEAEAAVFVQPNPLFLGSSMLDQNLLRRDLPSVVKALSLRGLSFDTERFNRLESERKAVQMETEALQARRNALAKQIGQLKSRGEDASAVMAESQAIPEQLKQLESRLGAIQEELSGWLLTIPNLPHESVPEGKSEEDNVEVRRWLPPGMQADAQGNPPALAFEVRDHVAVGEPLGLDFETARKLSGSRFMMLRAGM